MREILIRLTALCMAEAVCEGLLGDARLRSSVRLLSALLAAELILEAVCMLPRALFA